MLTRKQQRHLDRLQKWADKLNQVPNHHFDINLYLQPGFENEDEEFPKTKEVLKCALKGKEIHNCGSAACALGYLPVIFPNKFDYTKQNYFNYGYLRDYFGLDQHQIDNIQYESSYDVDYDTSVTPKMAAKHILNNRKELEKKYERKNNAKS